MSSPSPAERFSLACEVNKLLHTLYLHPEFAYVPGSDHIADPSGTPVPLLFASDFAQRTYDDYIVPCLPANATKTCRALANCWSTDDPNLREDPLDPASYPDMSSAEMQERWQDGLGRSVLIAMVILDKTPLEQKGMQMLLTQRYDFGDEVEAAATAVRDVEQH